MVNFHQLNQGLVKRALATGCPRNRVLPFLILVKKWEHNSGQEWTVSRLKAIKLDLIRRQAGLSPVMPWIKRNTTGFAGVIGSVESWMFSHPSRFALGVQLIQLYTNYISAGVTPLQKEKFVSAVSTPPGDQSAVDRIGEQIISGLQRSPIRPLERELDPPAPLMDYIPSPTKRAPLPSGSVPEREGILDSLQYLTSSYQAKLHRDHYWSVYKHLMVGLGTSAEISWQFPGNHRDDEKFVVGRIGLIQEPGFKLRAVANPGRVFQRALEPLGKFLFKLVSKLPWDCTFDQSLAIPHVQSALNSGLDVYSVDLSNATDLFPLRLQMKILEWLLPCSKYPSLFREVSTAYWEMPNHGLIRWERGQPLGLFPSFASFAMTHGFLLWMLNDYHHDNSFFILGDDVVILSPTLADSYYHALDELGCKVSAPKSLQSNKLSEFAGKLITSTEVIPQLKWRQCSDDSFIDIVRLLGPRGVALLRTDQRKIVEAISSVPEFFGGLGWNPYGIPFLDRLEPWVFRDRQPVDRLTGLLQNRVRNFYSSRWFLNMASDLGITPKVRDTLVQRVLSLVSRHLSPALQPLYYVLGANLDMVVDDLDLPYSVSDRGRRVTLLQQWKHRLELGKGD